MTLKDQHKIVLAYLNIGEFDTCRSDTAQWRLGAKPDWQVHYFIDQVHKELTPSFRVELIRQW